MKREAIPIELQPYLDGYEFSRETIGQSGSDVFRITSPLRTTAIVKVGSDDAVADLRAEAIRLRWLSHTGILAPRVLHAIENGDDFWLAVECLPGENAATSGDAPDDKVRELATALKSLHALDAGACPFDETLKVKLAHATENARLKKVDESDFDDEYKGKTAFELLELLHRTRPGDEDIVVTHGDACLPNVMLNAGRFSGFVDCGRVGRSDRYQDLALACRSIRFNLGADWVEPFLRAYGIAQVDDGRMRFYRLLDEFF